MLITKQYLKENLINCYSVVYNPRYFQYHQFKIDGDAPFIKKLIDTNNVFMLQYMEEFYKLIRSNRISEKDIMSRMHYSQLEEKWKMVN
jgi:hypothetical protein